VVDTGNDRIGKFTDTGAYVAQWGQLATGPGQFLEPEAVAVDERGAVYVADGAAGRIQKLDSSGRLLEIIDVSPHAAVSSEPVDVEIDRQGNVYVADEGNPEAVYVFRPKSGESGAAVSVASERLRYRSGRIALRRACGASRTRRGTARVVKGTTTIATRSYAVRAGKRATVSLRATRRGRAKLARARTHWSPFGCARRRARPSRAGSRCDAEHRGGSIAAGEKPAGAAKQAFARSATTPIGSRSSRHPLRSWP